MPSWLANALLLIPVGVLVAMCFKPAIMEIAWKVLAVQALVMLPVGAWLGLDSFSLRVLHPFNIRHSPTAAGRLSRTIVRHRSRVASFARRLLSEE